MRAESNLFLKENIKLLTNPLQMYLKSNASANGGVNNIKVVQDGFSGEIATSKISHERAIKNLKKRQNKKLICKECGGETEDSHYRENEEETVCEECYTEWLAEHINAPESIAKKQSEQAYDETNF